MQTPPRTLGLNALFESWGERDLSEERYAVLYLDEFQLKVCLARRVVSVAVLAVLGVAEDGTKAPVSPRLAVSEAAARAREGQLVSQVYSSPRRTIGSFPTWTGHAG